MTPTILPIRTRYTGNQMGLFSRSGVKWRCERCGHIHKKNPDECENCKYTVFIQHNASTKPSTQSKSKSSSWSLFSSRTETGWRCTKCGNRHERKPFVCDDCGSSALREYEYSPGRASSGPALTEEDTQNVDSTWLADLITLLLVLATLGVLYWVFIAVF